MSSEQPLIRAQEVLRKNKYLALATVDAQGPWVATLAYVAVKPNFLCFFSQATSRHGRAMASETPIAGVIYDSTCVPETAESIQFSGKGSVVRDREFIAEVLRQGAVRNGEQPPTEEVIDEHVRNESTVLFRVSVDDAYVLDQELFTRDGIDGRERVDAQGIFSILT